MTNPPSMTLEQVSKMLRFSALENVNMDAVRIQCADAIDAHLAQHRAEATPSAEDVEKRVKQCLIDAICKYQFSDDAHRGRMTIDVETLLGEFNLRLAAMRSTSALK